MELKVFYQRSGQQLLIYSYLYCILLGLEYIWLRQFPKCFLITTFINTILLSIVMDLRDVKKEVEALPDINSTLKQFQNSWIKPIRKNTNKHISFINELDKNDKNEMNEKILGLNESIVNIKSSQVINEKLKHYARYLIELKLTTFNDNQAKSKVITNQFINDKFLNIKGTIREVKNFFAY